MSICIDDRVRIMARRCGLVDPDVFLNNKLPTNDPDGWGLGRWQAGGSGRTTRMLLKALVALQRSDTVEIVAIDATSATSMQAILAKLHHEAAGEPALLRLVTWTWPGHPGPRMPADVRLVDHAVVLAPAPC